MQDIDFLIHRTQSAAPGFNPVSVVFPTDGTEVISVYGSLTSQPYGAIYGYYGSEVKVDGKNGDIVFVSTPKTQTIADRISNLAYPIHSGDFAMGPLLEILRVLYSAMGLMPGILAMSGFFLWRMRLPAAERGPDVVQGPRSAASF